MRFGRAFYKMSGSGNDFVVFDEVGGPERAEPSPELVRALCRRGVGVGADGVVRLVPAPDADYRLLYYNADGGRATLCGNASLCGVRLAVELGYANGGGVRFLTDAGAMTGRILDGVPEIDLAAPTEVEAERGDLLGGGAAAHGSPSRVGFARVGVPHVVILCADVEAVRVPEVAPPIRAHASLRDGANVNYVSARADGRWSLRTYERGVEAETLACGTGSVATAALLRLWRGAGDGGGADEFELVTRSGQPLRVRLRPDAGGGVRPSLGGAARVVYRGELGEGDW